MITILRDWQQRCDALRARAHHNAITLEVDALIAEFERDREDGELHLVLSDSNWDDETLDHVAARCQDAGDGDAYALARLLLAMSFSQRMRLACVCDCGCTPERYRG